APPPTGSVGAPAVGPERSTPIGSQSRAPAPGYTRRRNGAAGHEDEPRIWSLPERDCSLPVVTGTSTDVAVRRGGVWSDRRVLAVIVTTYSAPAETLARCLRSVLDGGGADRVIVVDNGSSAVVPDGVELLRTGTN